MHIVAHLSTRAVGDFTQECLFVSSLREQFANGRLTVCYRDDRPYKTEIVQCINNADAVFKFSGGDPALPLDHFDMSHGKHLTGVDALDAPAVKRANFVFTSSMYLDGMMNGLPSLAVMSPPQWMRSLGFDPSRWHVVVYWKESGYEFRQTNHLRTITNPTPYLAAIEHILAQGGQVIRIGHPTATKITRPSVLDLANIPETTELQLVATATARFMLASGSGPQVWGTAFGVPTVGTDMIHAEGLYRESDYIVTQEFVGPDQHPLSGFEALYAGYLNDATRQASDLYLVPNRADQIIAAVDEVIAYSAETRVIAPIPRQGYIALPFPRRDARELMIPYSQRKKDHANDRR